MIRNHPGDEPSPADQGLPVDVGRRLRDRNARFRRRRRDVGGDEPAGLRFRLLDEEGNVAAEGERELTPGAHLARFVGELFDDPGLDVVDFESTLVLESDMPVSVTALRTRRGAFVSSHPVGRPVR